MNDGLKIGDVVEVTTERLAYGGDAVARHQRLAIFIPLAAPGERLRVRITERRKHFARAMIDRIIDPSSSRREAPCKYFGKCGGCQLQHLTYEAQLEAKTGFVHDALERIGRIDWPREIEILHASEFGYRTRAQVKIDAKTKRIGFNRAASNAVCDVESCPILVPELDQALRTLRDFVSSKFDSSDQPVRYSNVEIAAGESGIALDPVIEALPNDGLRRVVNNESYSFTPLTFFQSNASLLDVLVNQAIGEESGQLAIDLYAGVGLFTLPLARRFDRVIGVEADRQTTQCAQRNLKHAGLTNVGFHNNNAETWLKSFSQSLDARPDLVVLDPPRAGAADVVSHISALKPARISYVSCDPTTLARDLRALVDDGYNLSNITAIDMFPQTYHVETVAKLDR